MVGAAQRMTRQARRATGRLNQSNAATVWVSGSETSPTRKYPASGAADPATNATPSNQRGRHSFSGMTAAGCEGKVAGTPRSYLWFASRLDDSLHGGSPSSRRRAMSDSTMDGTHSRRADLV